MMLSHDIHLYCAFMRNLLLILAILTHEFDTH